ncbi:MAG: hypothetical protein CVV64_18585 [Candidatus Wallbacteria bacterium HGW-Wallbacteria-1]|jgi:hypothetical protein|uniref:SH3b domain-containing protein n=1 Tax=Candidatus Wallbacteria bacterium HGW-Wallbacteria-1 TaxID=2013854 RepID=A0A2N1PJI3_9BACT|nr:MAG: hypothetical protein CVV64_18585 [Candidatus Wallbacteria bacterium HGW-Wallbacteria-1]
MKQSAYSSKISPFRTNFLTALAIPFAIILSCAFSPFTLQVSFLTTAQAASEKIDPANQTHNRFIKALLGKKWADSAMSIKVEKTLALNDSLETRTFRDEFIQNRETIPLAGHCMWLTACLETENQLQKYEKTPLWAPAPRFMAFTAYLALKLDFSRLMRGNSIPERNWVCDNLKVAPAFTGQVNNSRHLRLRRSPNGGLLKWLAPGETFNITGLSGDWVRIDHAGQTGYAVLKDFEGKVFSVRSPW